MKTVLCVTEQVHFSVLPQTAMRESESDAEDQNNYQGAKCLLHPGLALCPTQEIVLFLFTVGRYRLECVCPYLPELQLVSEKF